MSKPDAVILKAVKDVWFDLLDKESSLLKEIGDTKIALGNLTARVTQVQKEAQICKDFFALHGEMEAMYTLRSEHLRLHKAQGME